MGIFYTKLILFTTIQLFLVGICFLFFKPDPKYYFAASLDKHRLARETNSPKILLAGGSSVAWGTNSSLIFQQLQLPVVNLAYNAGQGMDYRLNEVLEFAQPGDIIILSIEYPALQGTVSPSVVWRIIELEPSNISFFRWPQYKAMLDTGFLVGLRDLTRRIAQGKGVPKLPYSRDTFNEFGDAVGYHKLKAPKDINSGKVKYSRHNFKTSIRKLNHFSAKLRQRGAEVLYFFPAIPEEDFIQSEEALNKIYNDMTSELDIQLLNSPGEMAYKRSDFFDTNYHLKKEAGVRRTLLMINRLSQYHFNK